MTRRLILELAVPYARIPLVLAMHVSDPTDVALLQRIASRDTAALAELYDRHNRLLFGLILRIVRNRTEAEDVLQEVFVKVWTRAVLYDPMLGGPTPWLVRLSRNRAIDHIRGRKRAINTASLEESTVDVPSSTDIRSPETVVLAGEKRGAVMDALSDLAPEQRCLIEAAFFDGFTHSELATHFGLPLGTVKTRIRTGMLAMRHRLERAV